jgi:hypothetical protein
MLVLPQLSTNSSSVRFVATTYFGIAFSRVLRILAVGELRKVRPDLAECLVSRPPEQHRRALVLLATLELVGRVDELDVLERGADPGAEPTRSAVGRQRH